jgi:hypothetical protein
MNAKQAKDFLVQQASEQAALDCVPLSDLEKRMMYFSEGDASCESPLEVNEQFEGQYESAKYETKMSCLLHHAYKRLKVEDSELMREWNLAIRTLFGQNITQCTAWCGRKNLCRSDRAGRARLEFCFRLVLAETGQTASERKKTAGVIKTPTGTRTARSWQTGETGEVRTTSMPAGLP